MFITLTINTNIANKSKKIKFSRKVNLAQGWRKHVYTQKRSIFDKFNKWRKSLKEKEFVFDKQVVTFATNSFDL